MAMSSHTPQTATKKIAVPSLFAGKAWQQVLARDAKADGQFFYAVKSTRIYCKPSCPSRRPTRKNVTFFPTTAAAQAAGYRACLRCEPDRTTPKADPQAGAIAAVTEYLDAHVGVKTKLEDVAKATGVGKFTILRGFKRVLGVSPREYVKAKKLEKFRDRIKTQGRVTDAIYEAGFSSSSRLYEGSDAKLGMTPTAMRAHGAGVAIRYAIAKSPLGKMLVATTVRGVCAVAFGDKDVALIEELRERFSKAKRTRDDAGLADAVRSVAAHLGEHAAAADLPMDVRATAFQERVWRELRTIPRGETRTYSQIAKQIGKPKAVRAVAGACAANPVAVVVPCHRVVGADGTLTGYRWGVERKRRLLEQEAH